VTLVAILFSWLAIQVERGRRQQRAAAAITKLGGRVGYEFQMTGNFPFGGWIDSRATSTVPAFARSLLGNDTFDNVVYVDLYPAKGFANDDLAHLADLPHVRQLFIAGDGVTAEGLRHLKGLHNLEELSLNIPMTDEGLRQLSPLKSLKMLFLMGTSDEYRAGSATEVLFDEPLDYDSGVTKTGVERLAAEIPGIRISY
jgi:hypothetical protein